jgi:hypothetical protein
LSFGEDYREKRNQGKSHFQGTEDSFLPPFVVVMANNNEWGKERMKNDPGNLSWSSQVVTRRSRVRSSKGGSSRIKVFRSRKR